MLAPSLLALSYGHAEMPLECWREALALDEARQAAVAAAVAAAATETAAV